MKTRNINCRARLGTALAALAIGLTAVAAPTAASAAQPKAYASGAYRPTTQVLLNVGEGQMVNLPRSVSSVWTSNPKVADVYVNSPHQINLFGKDAGEATVIATSADGSVVYGVNIRVNQNISSINEILHQAMPGSDIDVRTVGQVAVINGTVSSPEDAAQAEMLVKAALNPGVDVSKSDAALNIVPVSRLKVATPLQVNLRVKIAEVSRDLLKQIGVNLFSKDATSGFKFGLGQGSSAASSGPGSSPFTVNPLASGTTLGIAGKLFGLDLAGALDLAENDGVVTILAEPNLTALSGETASFLAGGEFPIPVSQSLGAVTIEYKQYGVGLAFTPIVLEDGRISMRVRPEVSELSDAGSVTLNNFKVPALTTRRAETTVELGSGQSFMIAGLLRNNNSNSINKAPFLGDLPILGALFRSTKWQRQETELVIVVTPYLVRPVSGHLAMPTNGFRAPTDVENQLEGQSFKGVSGAPAHAPVVAPGVMTGGAAATPGFKL